MENGSSMSKPCAICGNQTVYACCPCDRAICLDCMMFVLNKERRGALALWRCRDCAASLVLSGLCVR